MAISGRKPQEPFNIVIDALMRCFGYSFIVLDYLPITVTLQALVVLLSGHNNFLMEKIQ